MASGRGSNFGALAKAIQRGDIPQAEIVLLLCNRPQAPALTLAATLGIPSMVIPSAQFKKNRQAYEQALLEKLTPFKPDWICLAGYMLLIGKEFIEHYQGKIINIHPSLLPAFKGLEAQRQALEAGVSETGCTVHFVTEEMDAGPMIKQNRISVIKGETPEQLAERLLPLEHATYISALRDLCQKSFTIKEGRVLFGANKIDKSS